MKQIVAFGLLLFGMGCTTTPVQPPAYSFRVIDDTARRFFVFELASQDARALCFSADAWPRVVGDIVWNPVELVAAGQRFSPAQSGNSDAGMLCGLSKDRDCGTWRLEPYEVQTVQLKYALFADPTVVAADETRHFDLHPSFPMVKVCRNRHARRF